MAKEARMTLNDLRVLVFGENSEETAAISGQIVMGLESDLTIVDTLDEARALRSSNAYDAVILVSRSPQSATTDLLSAVDRETPATPVIVLADQPDAETVLEIVRAGAADVLPMQVDARRLAVSICRAARTFRRQRMMVSRNQRLRRISSRLVRDRRDLRRRVDLICKDFVEAYRRLAERVVSGAEDHAASGEVAPKRHDPSRRRPACGQ